MVAKNKYLAGVRPQQPKRKWSGRVFVSLAALLLIVAATVSLWAWHTHRRQVVIATNNAHITKEQQNGKSTSSPQQSSTNTSTQTPPSSNSQDKSTGSAGAPSSSQPLQSPGTYSTFASDYNPGASDEELTTCVTTPGASCMLIFTRNNVTRTLPAQTTDSTGTAYMYWSPVQAKLSSGNWIISLKATLSGTSKTAQSSIVLQVK